MLVSRGWPSTREPGLGPTCSHLLPDWGLQAPPNFLPPSSAAPVTMSRSGGTPHPPSPRVVWSQPSFPLTQLPTEGALLIPAQPARLGSWGHVHVAGAAGEPRHTPEPSYGRENRDRPREAATCLCVHSWSSGLGLGCHSAHLAHQGPSGATRWGRWRRQGLMVPCEQLKVWDRTRGCTPADQGPGPLVGAEKGISGQGRERGWAVSLLVSQIASLPSSCSSQPSISLFLHSHVHSFVRSFIPGVSPERACESARGASGSSPTRPAPLDEAGGASSVFTPAHTPGAHSCARTRRLAHTHPPPATFSHCWRRRAGAGQEISNKCLSGDTWGRVKSLGRRG